MSTPEKSANEYKLEGNKAFAQKDYKTAIDLFTKAIDKDASNHVFFSNRSGSYINIGEWMYACSYGVFDGNDMNIHFFENDEGEVFSNDK